MATRRKRSTDQPAEPPRGRSRRARKLVMPDLVGLPIDDAQLVLQQAGFPNAANARFVEDYAELGSVVVQSPARGQLVDSDVNIELRVSARSWIHHLPQIYQAHAQGEDDLLFRLLWIFQQVHASVKDQIAEIPTLFKPLETRAGFLPWLGSWLALQVELDWPEAKQRRWIRHAPRLFAIRGTRAAMVELIELETGLRPTIHENTWPGEAFKCGVESVIGESSTVLPPLNLRHTFVVELGMPADALDDDALVRLHRVIQAEKPAHTRYFLSFAQASREATDQTFMEIGDAAI